MDSAGVPIDSCPISVEPINDLLSGIGSLGQKIQGKISSITLEADAGGVVAVLKFPLIHIGGGLRYVVQAAREHFSDALIVSGEREMSGFGRGAD